MVAKFLDEVICRKDFPFLKFLYNDKKDYEYLISQEEVKGVFFQGNSIDASYVASLAGRYIKPSVVQGDTSNSILLTDPSKLNQAIRAFVSSRLENNGIGHTNIKKLYVVKELEHSFFKALTAFLDSETYLTMCNEFNDETFQEESEELLNHVKRESFKLKYCKGDYTLNKFSMKNPLVIQEQDDDNYLMNKGDLYGPIFLYKVVNDLDHAIECINESKTRYQVSFYSTSREDLG